MEGVNGILVFIAAILALAALAGTAYIVFRNAADKATIESQQRSIVALETELGIEKRRTERLEAQVKVCEAKIEALTLLKSHSVELAAVQLTVDEIRTGVHAVLEAVSA